MYYTVQDYKDIYFHYRYTYIYIYVTCLILFMGQCLPKKYRTKQLRQSWKNPSGFCQVAVGDLCEYAVDQCIRLQELPEHVRHGRLSITHKTLKKSRRFRFWNHWTGNKKTVAGSFANLIPLWWLLDATKYSGRPNMSGWSMIKIGSRRDFFLLLSGSSWRDASQHRTVCSDVRLEMLVVFTVPVLTSTQSTNIWQIAVWNWKLTVGRRYDVDRCTPGTRLTCIGSLAWRFPERS